MVRGALKKLVEVAIACGATNFVVGQIEGSHTAESSTYSSSWAECCVPSCPTLPTMLRSKATKAIPESDSTAQTPVLSIQDKVKLLKNDSVADYPAGLAQPCAHHASSPSRQDPSLTNRSVFAVAACSLQARARSSQATFRDTATCYHGHTPAVDRGVSEHARATLGSSGADGHLTRAPAKRESVKRRAIVPAVPHGPGDLQREAEPRDQAQRCV